jgi:hypothetical protein
MRRHFLILLVALLGTNAVSAALPPSPAPPPPQPPPAGSIGYSNDTNMPIVVQGSSMAGGRPAFGPAHPMRPNESAVDLISQPGVKTITVSDPKGAILFRGQVTVAGKDQFFSIQLELNPDKSIRGAKLVPAAPPGRPR